MTNSLGLNSLYTVAFAAYSIKIEGDVKKYGKMDELEAYTRVKNTWMLPNLFQGEVPFLTSKTGCSTKNTTWSSFYKRKSRS